MELIETDFKLTILRSLQIFINSRYSLVSQILEAEM